MAQFLDHLENIIEQRKQASAEQSYTKRLFDSGYDRILQKVGEESVEFILAAKNRDKQKIAEEGADLLFHLLVSLSAADMKLQDLIEVLQQRHKG
jgi:phosphoribosyl-ATP pyrophosphohydrolase/phosphoribosyl-AMP cyclohydrolase